MPKKTNKSEEQKLTAAVEQAAAIVEPSEKPKKSKKSKKADNEAVVDEVSVAVSSSKEDKKSKKRTREEKTEEATEVSSADAATEEAAVDSVTVCVPVKAKKPLPPGYVCKACGGGGHAIYDCPSKIPRKGTEGNEPAAKAPVAAAVAQQKEKKGTKADSKVTDAAINENKTYVSGLPFDMTDAKLKELFEDKGCQIKSHSLVMFEDNKSKCKGFGFVTFADPESTQKAIAMTGANMGKKTLAVVQCVDKNSEKKEEHPSKKQKAPRCYRCGESHDPATCNNPRICYRCRSSTHISSQCPLKKKSSE